MGNSLFMGGISVVSTGDFGLWTVGERMIWENSNLDGRCDISPNHWDENFKIYYGNKKSYVNIFDSENNKVYLFDEGLKLINGFPISSIQNADFSISNEGIEFSKKTESKKFTYQTVK